MNYVKALFHIQPFNFILLVMLLLIAYKIEAATLILHPSGEATGDNIHYEGGTAATAMDTDDQWGSYGQSYNELEDYYVEIDNTNINGIINSVVIKALVSEADWPSGTSIFRIGLITNGVEFLSSNISQSTSSFVWHTGNTYSTNPQTNSSWTWAEINDLIVSVDNTVSNTMRITELYVEIDYTPTTDINMVVNKTSTLISDPIHSTGINKNRIPGAIIEYRITVTNLDTTAPDTSSIVITDIINDHVEYRVSSTSFNAYNSNLTLQNITYSHKNTPNNYNYSPNGIYDPNVANIKITTNGTFNYNDTPDPYFTVTYRVKIQ